MTGTGSSTCAGVVWLLCSIVLVVKAFNVDQVMQFSPHRNMQQEQKVAYNLLDGMNRLAMGSILSMVLQPFPSFAGHGSHSPSTTMGSRRQPKSGKQPR